MRRALLVLLVLTAPPALAQTGALGAGEGAFPCDALALVALPDHGEALGLAATQTRLVDSLHAEHLRQAHELFGEIAALREALHRLDRPFAPGELFALFYDLGRHEEELAGVFGEGARAILAVLTPDQRERWDALVREAESLEAPGTCTTS